MRSIDAGKYPLHPAIDYEVTMRQMSAAGELLAEALNTHSDFLVSYWHRHIIHYAHRIEDLRAWMTRERPE